jgi:hypothetical protein
MLALGDDAEGVHAAINLALAGALGSGAQAAQALRALWPLMVRPDEPPAPSTLPPRQLTVAVLKQACEAAELHVSGTKAALLERLTPLCVPPALRTRVRAGNAVARWRAKRAAASAAYQNVEDGNYQRMPASRAKGRWLLTEDDVDDVVGGVEYATNPHNRHGPSMRLYLERVVRAVSLAKYGGEAGLAAARSRKSQKYVERIVSRQDKRCAELEAALAPRGLEVRADSALCNDYIEGRRTLPLASIAEIMDEMRWYHARTRYAELRDELFDELYEKRDRDREMWGEDSGWIDPHQVSEDAQMMAMGEFLDGLEDVDAADAALADPILPPSLRQHVQNRHINVAGQHQITAAAQHKTRRIRRGLKVILQFTRTANGHILAGRYGKAKGVKSG